VQFDALAGTYRMFLSQNGAAETLEASFSSTARICALTRFRLGRTQQGAFADFNGWLDAFRVVRCATKTGTETPSASAPTITDYPYHFFSIPEMKMYEVTSASVTAGVNPGMTQRNRLFLGECDTSGAAVTAVRTYQLCGRALFDSANPSIGTELSVTLNIGVPPSQLEIQRYAQVAVANVGYKAGDLIKLDENNYAQVLGRAYSTYTKGRNTLGFRVETEIAAVGPSSAGGIVCDRILTNVRRAW
jgi:hypothetical protein